MKIWTSEEIDYLKHNYGKINIGEISSTLKKSESSIRNKMNKLKLKLGPKSQENLIGKQFFYLTVISLSNERIRGNRAWNCACKCGNIVIVTTARLKIGNAKSCGCYMLEKVRSAPGESSCGKIFARYRWNAKTFNRINDLEDSQVKYICSLPCTYCDKDPVPWNGYLNTDGTTVDSRMSKEATDRSWININGIDRINNNIGYTLENSVSCCSECNFMKNDMNFWNWIAQIERFQSGFIDKIIRKLKVLEKNIPPKI